MNEARGAALEQLGMTIEAAMSQLTALLEAERSDVQVMPDSIDDFDFEERVAKRPVFELAAARVLLIESVEHISKAIKKQDRT